MCAPRIVPGPSKLRPGRGAGEQGTPADGRPAGVSPPTNEDGNSGAGRGPKRQRLSRLAQQQHAAGAGPAKGTPLPAPDLSAVQGVALPQQQGGTVAGAQGQAAGSSRAAARQQQQPAPAAEDDAGVSDGDSAGGRCIPKLYYSLRCSVCPLTECSSY